MEVPEPGLPHLVLLRGGARHNFSSAQELPRGILDEAATKTQLELGGSQKARPGSELGRRLPEPNKADIHPRWKKGGRGRKTGQIRKSNKQVTNSQEDEATAVKR